MMKWFLAALAAFFLSISIAFAGTGTITVLDSGGVTRTYALTTDGSGNFISKSVLCDSTAGANCATVNGSSQLLVLEGNSGSILTAVQGSVPAGTNSIGGVTQSGNWSQRLQDGTGNAITSDTRGSERPLSVQILDASGNQITAFGGSGGTASNFNSAFPTQGTAIGVKNGANMVNLSADASSNLNINLAACASGVCNVNGQATMANSSPVVIASNQAAYPITVATSTTGGDSTTGNIAANNTTAVVVKNSAGTLYGAQLAGIGSAPAYLKLYNATSATCGSGTPIKRLIIPAASTAANGAGSNIFFGPQGIAFGTGITYCVTTGITDADTTAPAANTFLINLDWS